MVKRFLSINAITFTLIAVCLTASTTATATNTGFTTLNVNGETVKIYGDDFAWRVYGPARSLQGVPVQTDVGAEVGAGRRKPSSNATGSHTASSASACP